MACQHQVAHVASDNQEIARRQRRKSHQSRDQDRRAGAIAVRVIAQCENEPPPRPRALTSGALDRLIGRRIKRVF